MLLHIIYKHALHINNYLLSGLFLPAFLDLDFILFNIKNNNNLLILNFKKSKFHLILTFTFIALVLKGLKTLIISTNKLPTG